MADHNEKSFRKQLANFKRKPAKTFDAGIGKAVGKIPGVSNLKAFVRSSSVSKRAKKNLAENRRKKSNGE